MTPTPFVRRDVWSLAPEDPIVTSYAAAVELMRGRAAEDPTSWSYQAAIHGTHAPAPPPLANSCKHGTWYFLPWHRMFLLHFEEIVRAAVVETGGPEDWALPYWNYGLNGRDATLPLAFRAPTVGGRPNPLFVAERNPGINAGAAMPPEVTSAAVALARTQFVGRTELGGGVTGTAQQFYAETGRLEQTPHNDVHVVVGGRGGWMADPDRAAQDPIFWSHHANVDRLWDAWAQEAGHADPTDARWADAAFELFDAEGSRVSHTCASVRDILALGYTYDTRPSPGAVEEREVAMAGGAEPEMVGASEREVRLVGTPTKVAVPIDARARETFLESLPSTEGAPRVYLNVDDIEADENPGTVYGVYVNLPDDAPPEQAPAHHAGNVSFFGIERARNPRADEPGHGLRVSMEITQLAHDLAARNAWDDQRLEVTFRPIDLIPPEEPGPELEMRPASPEDPPVRIGRVSVFYG